mgnify:CR=1 FL=1
MREQAGDPALRCPYCGRAFSRASDLTRHVKARHARRLREFLCLRHRELLRLLDDWRSVYELSELLRLRGIEVGSERLKEALFYLARHGIVEVRRVDCFPHLLFKRCFESRLFEKKRDLREAIVEALRRHRVLTTGELYDLVSRRLPLPEDVVSHLPTLSTYYLVARYPNAGLRRPSLAIGRRQAEEAVEVAGRVLRAIKEAVGEA